MKVTRRSVLVGLALAIAACQRNTTTAVDRRKVLSDLASLVIVPSYEDASTTAASLVTTMEHLAAASDAVTLASAKEAWKVARAAWKRTDAFLFGPADDLAVAGGVIDSGPPDGAKLAELVSATTTLDEQLVAMLGGNQRGFAGLEWLLFESSSDPAAPRRRALGALVARDLRAKIDAVRDAWLPGKGGYATALADAGRGSAIYDSERRGIDEIVNALIAAAEILTAVRLARPLGLDRPVPEAHPELVESPLANTSLDDILHVIDGIESIYTCSRGQAARGASISDAVRELAPGADDRLRADIAGAREAVRAVPPPLSAAVSGARDAALAAHAAVREIKRRLSTEISGALGTSVGFNVTDGD